MLRPALTLRNIPYAEYCARSRGRDEVQPGHREQVAWAIPGLPVRTCSVDGMQRGVGPCMRRNGLQTPKTHLLAPLRRRLAPEPDATLPAGTGKWPRHRLSRKLGWHSAPAKHQVSCESTNECDTAERDAGDMSLCHRLTPISSFRIRVRPGQRSQVQQLSLSQISLLGS